MPAVDFPTSPAVNQQAIADSGVTWYWTGVAWRRAEFQLGIQSQYQYRLPFVMDALIQTQAGPQSMYSYV